MVPWRLCPVGRRFLPSLLCVAACSTEPKAAGSVDLLVRSDKSVYSLAVDSSARPTLLNRGERPVYLPMNEYVAVEHLSAGAWEEGVVWFAVDGPGISFRVEPGDSVLAFPMSFGYINRQPGQYRFVFAVALDSLGHDVLPYSATRSAPFEVQP
jgi:hypothetical protein